MLSPCCINTSIHCACSATSGKYRVPLSTQLRGDAVSQPGQDLDVLQPSFHRKLRILLLSNIILCTSLLQELYTIFTYAMSQIYIQQKLDFRMSQ